MSVLLSNDHGWIISHQKFFENIKVTSQPCLSVNTGVHHDTNVTCRPTEVKKDSCCVTLNPNLFEITEPFKTRVNVKGKPVKNHTNIILSETTAHVKNISDAILSDAQCRQIFQVEGNTESETHLNNDDKDDARTTGVIQCTNIPKTKESADNLWPKSNIIAIAACKKFFEITQSFAKLSCFHGENPFLDSAVWSTLKESSDKVKSNSAHRYLFPTETRFYCNDVKNMEKVFRENNEKEFDLIVMDPPWWNKFIRRKKRKQHEAAYEMIDDEGIGKLPIKSILKEDGLVVVWCTNAKSHQDKLIKDHFPQWGVKLQNTVYWLKVTKSGVPICPFNVENKKQPYETIFIGRKVTQQVNYSLNDPLVQNKPNVIISVPSSINSHKPPLINVIRDLYPHKVFDKKLEIFARYLIPGFVSYGNEVVKLQHESLYVTT